jgi:hypothetical protein
MICRTWPCCGQLRGARVPGVSAKGRLRRFRRGPGKRRLLARQRRDSGRHPSGNHQGWSGHTSAQPMPRPKCRGLRALSCGDPKWQGSWMMALGSVTSNTFAHSSASPSSMKSYSRISLVTPKRAKKAPCSIFSCGDPRVPTCSADLADGPVQTTRRQSAASAVKAASWCETGIR